MLSVGLLEEEKTGRTNRMFLLQPKATQEDFYTMSKQEQDIDHFIQIKVREMRMVVLPEVQKVNIR